MSRFSFLETNPYFIKKERISTTNDFRIKTQYQYHIKKENTEYKVYITLSDNNTKYEFRYRKKIGTGNMWMEKDLSETPIWFQNLIYKVENLTTERQNRRMQLQSKMVCPSLFYRILNDFNRWLPLKKSKMSSK